MAVLARNCLKITLSDIYLDLDPMKIRNNTQLYDSVKQNSAKTWVSFILTSKVHLTFLNGSLSKIVWINQRKNFIYLRFLGSKDDVHLKL